VTYKFDIIDYSVSGECGGDSGAKREGEERKVRGRKEEKRGKNWGRERKGKQERAKQINIWTEWKSEIGINKMKNQENNTNKIK
jgi:hypothetical protein